MIQHYTSFPKDKPQTPLANVLANNHVMISEVLRILTNRFPSLIGQILKYRIPNDYIDLYFKSLAPLYETLSKNKNLVFFDFIWLINPYHEPLCRQIFQILVNQNYFLKYVDIGGKNRV